MLVPIPASGVGPDQMMIQTEMEGSLPLDFSSSILMGSPAKTSGTDRMSRGRSGSFARMQSFMHTYSRASAPNTPLLVSKQRFAEHVMYSSGHTPTGPLYDLWKTLDKDSLGLDYAGIMKLLRLLAVQMDHCTEIDFFHSIDPVHIGTVYYSNFEPSFQTFKKEKKFTSFAPLIQTACATATLNGLTLDQVYSVWYSFDPQESMLGKAGISGVLKQLSIPHTDADVAELIEMVHSDPESATDPQNEGMLEMQDFFVLFSSSQKGDDEIKFENDMAELHKVVAARDRQRFTITTKEQRNEVRLQHMQVLYERFFLPLIYAYSQVNITVPILLFCFLDPFVEFKSGPHLGPGIITVMLLLSDIVMWCQVWCGFHFPKANELGVMVYNPSDIVRMNLHSPSFYLELIIALPMELIAGIVAPQYFMHPLFRLNKLLLLYYSRGAAQNVFSKIFGQKWWRIVDALYWWLLFGHLVACIFNQLCIRTGDESVAIVLTVPNYSELDMATRYLQSLSYAVNTMAGLSRGKFPDDDAQAVFALLVVLIGVFVYALVFAVVGLALQTQDAEGRFDGFVEEMCLALSDDLARGRIPENFVKEVVDYHKHIFRSTGQFHLGEEMLPGLPPPLKVSLDLIIGRDTVGQLSLLKSATQDDEFIYALQQCLQLVVLPPGHTIIEEGADGNEMFFIRCGVCEVEVDGNVVCELSAGDMFGEIAILTNVTRTATVRTVGFCNLLILTAQDFSLVVSAFPHLRTDIEAQATARLNQVVEEEPFCSANPEHNTESASSGPDVLWRAPSTTSLRRETSTIHGGLLGPREAGKAIKASRKERHKSFMVDNPLSLARSPEVPKGSLSNTSLSCQLDVKLLLEEDTSSTKSAVTGVSTSSLRKSRREPSSPGLLDPGGNALTPQVPNFSNS